MRYRDMPARLRPRKGTSRARRRAIRLAERMLAHAYPRDVQERIFRDLLLYGAAAVRAKWGEAPAEAPG